MQVTISLLNTWYNEFKGIVFDDDMPKVTFIINNTHRQLGQAQRRGTTYIIKVSNYYERSVDDFRNTLLHEMCHIWCYYHGYRDEHHTGYHWHTITTKAYKKTGILITRCQDADNFKPAKHNEEKAAALKAKKEAPAIIVDFDYGSYHFIVKTTKKVIWDASDGNQIKGYGRNVCGIYLCDNKRVLDWQNSRSLHRGYKFLNYEYERDIKPMLNKAIKVEDLRKLCWWGEYDFLGVR